MLNVSRPAQQIRYEEESSPSVGNLEVEILGLFPATKSSAGVMLTWVGRWNCDHWLPKVGSKLQSRSPPKVTLTCPWKSPLIVSVCPVAGSVNEQPSPVTEGWEPTIEKGSLSGFVGREPQPAVVNSLEPVEHPVGVALKGMSTNSPEANLSLPVAALATILPVPGSYDAVQFFPGEALTVPKRIGLNSRGTVMRTCPKPIVLEAVQGAAMGVPQFLTSNVQFPSTPPAAVFGEIVAENCFTAAFAPLTLGAATRAPIKSKAAATRASLWSFGLSSDMSCPFFLAGHTTRMTLLPRKPARDPRTDLTS